AANETVEKVQFRRFHGKVLLENKGVIDVGFLDFRVFRQSQLGRAGDGFQPPLRCGFQPRLTPSVRLLEAAKSVQRACYTDVSRLCTVESVLCRKGPPSMLSEPQRRHSAV